MSGFYRTNLGRVALQQRNITLNAKQRRLLLLIDHEDFQSLDTEFKKRIAPPELIQQLIDLKLIAPSSENYSELPEQISPPESSITTKEIHQKNVDENKSNDLVGEIQVPQSTSAPSNIENNQPSIPVQQLSFEEIQQLMKQSLSQYCGLMAKPLIQKIEQIKTLQELKMCQMQWITSLQESRIPPHELAHTLHSINYSIQLIQQRI
ncbi:TPA: hypothetical protein JIZ13_03270 [Acinetobacter nosocomialis]|uniref:Uncharacterized protein n=1 Tax=Acinetobacter nosocomialis TaxID=106654 RepID=A0A2L1VEK7_ACINO|nr:hypothetical protein [Acinetobacter nosocomialis]ARG16422.1 hypothetical protein B7L44_07325 [Acinetobacter nosocomialis]AVF43643.1 hypothetical protein AL533_04180 [Acinetobacter nosocomialis]AWL18666.1 hypothetical protein DIW83_06295 [Acinetobacter nosocomialis]AZC09483.1 hypothetical protein DKE47_006700 [Acinetobacter nosocomialis]MBM9549855.1 hypothetical protein [Acinetobacter nosocomialis]